MGTKRLFFFMLLTIITSYIHEIHKDYINAWSIETIGQSSLNENVYYYQEKAMVYPTINKIKQTHFYYRCWPIGFTISYSINITFERWNQQHEWIYIENENEICKLANTFPALFFR